ncbi:unnamed protein product [Eruca vesicaria subsp. sativa]|uniref:Uncharacterized protein n=1 Tax=Eruca vesicaria subsp. sativa TaxID=29727 RepID=A0ABC8KE78_ERUVS|nr:unnamed protein product [Eruca vesicaria subsp. sativa]
MCCVMWEEVVEYNEEITSLLSNLVSSPAPLIEDPIPVIKPRYVQHLMKKAEQRQEEHGVVYERALSAQQRSIVLVKLQCKIKLDSMQFRTNCSERSEREG